jgi:hypothetical protein
MSTASVHEFIQNKRKYWKYKAFSSSVLPARFYLIRPKPPAFTFGFGGLSWIVAEPRPPGLTSATCWADGIGRIGLREGLPEFCLAPLIFKYADQFFPGYSGF